MSYPPPPPDPYGPHDPTATAAEGLGQPPVGGYPEMDYPRTAAFPAYPPPAAGPPPGGPGWVGPGPGTSPPGGPPPRRSNVPLIAVILACSLLLCGGTVFAGVLVVRSVADRAKEAVGGLPTGLPAPPGGLPTLPTGLPELPTGLPTLPTGLPDLPGLPTGDLGSPGRTVKVGYEVDGEGPADITYLVKTGEAPKTVRNAKLPWRLHVSMTGLSLASVVALRTTSAPGSIACRTTIDGAQAAQRTREGSFAVVTCSKLIIE